MSLLIIRGACVVQMEDSSFSVSNIKNMIWIVQDISCFSKGCSSLLSSFSHFTEYLYSADFFSQVSYVELQYPSIFRLYISNLCWSKCRRLCWSKEFVSNQDSKFILCKPELMHSLWQLTSTMVSLDSSNQKIDYSWKI